MLLSHSYRARNSVKMSWQISIENSRNWQPPLLFCSWVSLGRKRQTLHRKIFRLRKRNYIQRCKIGLFVNGNISTSNIGLLTVTLQGKVHSCILLWKSSLSVCLSFHPEVTLLVDGRQGNKIWHPQPPPTLLTSSLIVAIMHVQLCVQCIY